MKIRRVAASAVGVLIMIVSVNAAAVVYKYVDDKGTESYTDAIETVPERFRKKAVVVQGRVEKEQPAAEKESMAAPAEGVYVNLPDKAGAIGKYRRLFDENREARTALFVAGFLVLAFVAGRAGAALGHKQLSSVVRLALAAGLLLYLANAYLGDMASMYMRVRESVMGVKKQADERNDEIRKANDALFGAPKKQP